MIKKDGQWRIEKDVLGWTFEGKNKTMVLEEEKIKIILSVLKDWVHPKKGIPLVTSKIMSPRCNTHRRKSPR